MRFLLLFLISGFFTFSSEPVLAAFNCDGLQKATSGQILEKGPYRLVYRTDPETLTVGKFFGLTIGICTTDGSPLPDSLKVDATMPMHSHGMNYRSTVQNIAPGQFTAKGLMMHMAGSWMLQFDVRQGSTSTRIATKLTLK